MPSGAKKRKAAKRKQKQKQKQQQSANINSGSPSDPHPQGNAAVHDHHPAGRDAESSDRNHVSTDEEPEEGKKENTLENGKEESTADAMVDIGPKQRPPQLREGVHVESVQPMEEGLKETGPEKSGSEASAVVLILHSDLASEVAMQAREAIAETSVHAPNNVAEAENLPIATELIRETKAPAATASIEPLRSETYETAVSTEPHEMELPKTTLTAEPPTAGIPETAATTAKDIPASLMHHRTTWWNCCGLFDVITGSQR